MAGNDAHALELAGREVQITSPGKVLFAERGETKLDLVRYYAAVSEPLMRAMGGRPVLMQRFPHGAQGPSFFQKRVPQNAPEWLQTTTVTTVNGTPSRALVIADRAHVAGLPLEETLAAGGPALLTALGALVARLRARHTDSGQQEEHDDAERRG